MKNRVITSNARNAWTALADLRNGANDLSGLLVITPVINSYPTAVVSSPAVEVIQGKNTSARMASRAMKSRLDRVTVFSVVWTICLLYIMSWELKWAATWQTRHIWVMDRVMRLNYEASIAFASLTLDVIVLVVIWTSYQKRMLWAWFVLAVFVCVYFVPVHLLDVLLDMRRVGWSWWPAVVREAREGRPFAVGALHEISIFILLLIALFLPVDAFFSKLRPSPSGAGHSTP